jgi:hypothetical protein
MSNQGKLENINTVINTMRAHGWLNAGTTISFETLGPQHLKHFRAALALTEELLRWQLGFDDERGPIANNNALIVQTIARLNAELDRVERSVDSPLFYVSESKRMNRKGADPAVYQRIVKIGIFYRLYRNEFTSDNACSEFISKLLAKSEVESSVSSISSQINRFKSEFNWSDIELGHLKISAVKAAPKTHAGAVNSGRIYEERLLGISEPLRRSLLESQLVESAQIANAVLKQPNRPPRSRQQKMHRSRAQKDK